MSLLFLIMVKATKPQMKISVTETMKNITRGRDGGFSEIFSFFFFSVVSS